MRIQLNERVSFGSLYSFGYEAKKRDQIRRVLKKEYNSNPDFLSVREGGYDK
jgi:hypothetical protein